MGMPLEENISCVFGQIIEASVMAMREAHGLSESEKRSVVVKKEFGDHLVDFGIAVSFDRDQLGSIGVH